MTAQFSSTSVALLFLYFTITKSKDTRSPRKYSASPISRFQNVTEQSAIQQYLLLPEHEMDPCLRKSTVKARQECIEPVLETYYGHSFTATCPGLSLILAVEKCTGCPWNRINASALSELENISLPLERRLDYFHRAGEYCHIAHHVWVYRNWKTISAFIFDIDLIAAVLLFALSVTGAYSSIKNGVVVPFTLFGVPVPEALFQALFWAAFCIVFLLLALVQDYYRYCEPLAAMYSHQQRIAAAYATTLAMSMSRCLCLPHSRQDLNETSWYLFVRMTIRDRNSCTKKRKCLAFVIIGMLLVLCLMFIFDIEYAFFNPSTDESWCVAGRRGFQLRFGWLHYSKAVLEFVSVVVYSVQTRPDTMLANVRLTILPILIILSCVVGLLCGKTFCNINGHTMLIPRIRDQDSANPTVQLVHTVAVSLLGILEPLRPRCESQQRDTNE